MNEIQEALIDYVQGARKNAPFHQDLQAYLQLLPQGKQTNFIQIISDLGENAGAVSQSANLLDNVKDFVRRKAINSDAAFTTLASLNQSNTSFDTWVYAIRRTVSGVTGRLGERGVSLYHEFKVLSAICHATKGDSSLLAEGFTLVSGDFPGVQNFIYAIPSDGATKKVRGRSFFLQLLADCVVMRVLQEFELPITNALYTAGGKFLLLLPSGVEAEVDGLYESLSERFLAQFDGDLRLVLAAVPMPSAAIANTQAYKETHQRLAERIRQQKIQPFRNLLNSNLTAPFFAPKPDDLTDFVSDDSDARKNDAYAKLAQKLANTQDKDPYLVFSVDNSINQVGTSADYGDLFAYLTGIRCEILAANELKKTPSDSVKLKLNNPRFDGADGFRLLAARTPLVMDIDHEYWNKTLHKRQNSKREDDREPRVDIDIRNFEFLAAQGDSESKLTRYGVLRMDVDNLGKIFVGTGDANIKTLQNATLTRYLALSDSMSLFFEAYVPILCQQIEDEFQRPNSLYLIYGGGDDLFIVGEWDLLPHLAEKIRNELSTFSNGQVTISAGLMLFSQKYPFYRAAEETGTAEEKAKDYGRNAICFLNTVVDWDKEWKQVTQQYENLLELSEYTGSSITQNVLEIYRQWLEESGDAQNKSIHFGPYKWRAAYRMTKLAMQYGKRSPELMEAIRAVQRDLLNVETIRLSGVSARWAELQARLNRNK